MGTGNAPYRALLMLMLTLALVLAGVPPQAQAVDGNPSPSKISFTDLDAAPWAQVSVVRLFLNGMVRGYDDGSFRPGESVTRAELATFLVRALGLEAEAAAKGATALPFIDFLGIPAWARGHIAVATEQGFASGVQTAAGPAFLPGQAATRSQVIVMMVRAAGQDQEALGLAGNELSLTDAVQVPAWARGHVALALQSGLVSGYPDGTFRPDRPVTRAELAVLLERMAVQTRRFVSDLQGTLQAVELKGDGETMLRITTGVGSERALTVKANTPMFLDRLPIVASALTGGQRVVVQVAASDQAALVMAERPVPGSDPGGPASGTPASGTPFPGIGTGTQVTAGSLAFALSIPTVVPRGLPVELTLKVSNTSTSTVQVSFVSGQHFDFRAVGPVQWTWSNNRFFSQAVNTMQWAPGETRTFAVTWPQVDLQHRPARSGVYTVEAWFLGVLGDAAWGRSPVATATFTVTP